MPFQSKISYNSVGIPVSYTLPDGGKGYFMNPNAENWWDDQGFAAAAGAAGVPTAAGNPGFKGPPAFAQPAIPPPANEAPLFQEPSTKPAAPPSTPNYPADAYKPPPGSGVPNYQTSQYNPSTSSYSSGAGQGRNTGLSAGGGWGSSAPSTSDGSILGDLSLDLQTSPLEPYAPVDVPEVLEGPQEFDPKKLEEIGNKYLRKLAQRGLMYGGSGGVNLANIFAQLTLPQVSNYQADKFEELSGMEAPDFASAYEAMQKKLKIDDATLRRNTQGIEQLASRIGGTGGIF